MYVAPVLGGAPNGCAPERVRTTVDVYTLGAEQDVRRALFDVPLGSPTRPTWRGRLHVIALIVVTPLLALMATGVEGDRNRVGVIVYAAGLCSMLAVSAAYHRWVHTIRARTVWRRLDHAMIFAAIAGTCTPLALVLLEPAAAVVAIVATWSAALVGAGIKITGWRRGGAVGTAMYITNSWAGLILVPSLWQHSGPVPVILLCAGGLIYTLGAVGFRRHWPKLRESVFSYHEVWHLCTLAAAGAHLAAVWIVVSA